METFLRLLQGGDLRSLARTNEVVALVKDQRDADKLFGLLHHPDRKVVMRAADALEKITATDNTYLLSHAVEIKGLLFEARDKELKWHLSLLVSRLPLTEAELQKIWAQLCAWLEDKKESRIVRVNALQALYNLSQQDAALRSRLQAIATAVKQDHIQSLEARMRKLGL